MLPGAWEPELKPGNLAPRSGQRGFELHGQVVVDQQRDIEAIEGSDVDVEGLGGPIDGDVAGIRGLRAV